MGDDLERSLKILILSVVCTAFVATLAIYAIKYSTFKFTILPQLENHNEAMETYLSDFERDHRIVAENALSIPDFTNKDAGLVLNTRIPWTVGTHLSSALSLSKSVTKLLESASDQWVDIEPSIYVGLNFDWMTENIPYNYWVVWNNQLLKDHFTASPVEIPVPQPDYSQLLNWAKLRYIHALNNNDLLAAQSEIRHLAKLIETHETSAASDTSIKIFKLEAIVSKTTQAKAVDYVPLSEDLMRRLDATSRYLDSVLHPTTREDIVKNLVSFLKPQFGLCGKLAHYSLIRSIDIFRPNQFKDSIKILDRFAKTAPCRREFEDYLLYETSAQAFLVGHPFFSAMNKNKVSRILFNDSIGLIVDASTRPIGPFVYRSVK